MEINNNTKRVAASLNLFCILMCACSCKTHISSLHESQKQAITKPSKNDEKILGIIDGMYEVVSWNDGTKTHEPPAVSGRWVFHDKKVMSIIHNRTDSNSHKSSIGWGNGTVEGGKFQYAYTEHLNLQGTIEKSSLAFGSPWKGMRFFDVEIQKDGIKMTSENGKQTWIINRNGMVYTDREWGPGKVYAQRKWKRISNP